MNKKIINYTELTFPLDGIKYSEGYVLGEILRNSKFKHVVISSNNKYPLRKESTKYNQKKIGEKFFNTKIYNADNENKIFNKQTKSFNSDYIKKELNIYNEIIINFHSFLPQNIEMISNLKQLKKKFGPNIKYNYMIHNIENKSIINEQIDFYKIMDSFITFNKKNIKKFQQSYGLNNIFYTKYGVNENDYPIINKTSNNNNLSIGTNLLYSPFQISTFNLRTLEYACGINAFKGQIFIDYTHIGNTGLNFKNNYSILNARTYPGKEIKVTKGIYLKDICSRRDDIKKIIPQISRNSNYEFCSLNFNNNFYEDLSVFLSIDKSSELDINILKSLMSGIPIITPKIKKDSNILNKNNSLQYEIYQPNDKTWFFNKKTENRTIRDSIIKLIKEFDSSKFNPNLIRENLIKTGHTSKKMVKTIDTILSR
jgi:hypothetical protein